MSRLAAWLAAAGDVGDVARDGVGGDAGAAHHGGAANGCAASTTTAAAAADADAFAPFFPLLGIWDEV